MPRKYARLWSGFDKVEQKRILHLHKPFWDHFSVHVNSFTILVEKTQRGNLQWFLSLKFCAHKKCKKYNFTKLLYNQFISTVHIS